MVPCPHDDGGRGPGAPPRPCHPTHREIVLLGYEPGHTTGEARVAGYLKALADHGLPPSAARLHGTHFSRIAGYEVMRELLDACDGRPDFTAVVARDDESAAAAMRVLQERGLRVPEDIAVVGYNDDPVAAEVTPRLTTVHIPAEELGRTAVRLALDGPPATRPERHVLGTHFVIRESVRLLPRI